MSNPFEGKFKAFTANLSAKNNAQHAKDVAAKSTEVFQDKPFSVEFKTVYRVALVGQSLTQVVTYTTTAALGVFALVHIIPLWWGIYIAVPIALLFAFGVEKVKRSTLAIASKHLLKYKTFGFVGIVAGLVMCVSIAAALYGAKELPGVVFPKVERVTDGKSVEAITSDLKRVQEDIDRTTGKLSKGANWVAENRTLPKLQAQRAALVEKRTEAAKEAEQRADTGKQEAEAERVANVEKMQVYSVGAAIVAEVVFLLCTLFVFYFLFRHYAEVNEGSAPGEPGAGAGIHQEQRTGQGMRYTTTANFTTDENRLTKVVDEAPGQMKNRVCEWCKTSYIYAHNKQKYCCEKCRVEAWESRTGAKLKHKKSV